jgi:hypothetical protein
MDHPNIGWYVRMHEDEATGPWSKAYVFTESDMDDIAAALAGLPELTPEAVVDMLTRHESYHWTPKDCPRCQHETWTFRDGRCVACGMTYDQAGPTKPMEPHGLFYDACDQCGDWHPLTPRCPHHETER